MKSRKAVGKVARKLPISGTYLHLNDAKRLVETQKQEMAGMRHVIKQLEDRNDEWAAEVRHLRRDDQPLDIIWPVSPKEIVAADWHKPPQTAGPAKHQPPYTFNWVVPPMGQVSGGNVSIFRVIAYLESKGHTCRVYFSDARGVPTFEDVKRVMHEYPSIQAELFYNAEVMKPCDAIFATSWPTAYTVFNFDKARRKFYFVQDFEPYFEPVGSYSTLAENTYRFALHGVTLGKWLADKLHEEYGMVCDAVDLGVDSTEYYLTNPKPRRKVLFYTRPVSPRRGFELGILALEQFHKLHPEYEINLLGWDMSRYDIPFPFVNNGILSPEKLNELYNQCAAGLVLSFTNMSLLPLELLSSGCQAVMNDADCTRQVSYAAQLRYADPNPAALATALYQAISDAEQPKVIKELADYAKHFQWVDSNQRIEKLLRRELA
jgi:glycosyltransferase involved in cell wall biosynthesis